MEAYLLLSLESPSLSPLDAPRHKLHHGIDWDHGSLSLLNHFLSTNPPYILLLAEHFVSCFSLYGGPTSFEERVADVVEGLLCSVSIIIVQ
jgi:hypothetical protein